MHDDTARIVCEAKIINQLFARRGLSVHVPKAGHGGPSHYLTPTTVVYDLTVPMHVSGDKLVAQQDDALAYVRQFRRMNRIKSLDHSGMEVMPTVRIDRYEHTLEVSRPQPDMLPWKDAQWTPRPYTAFCGLRYSHEAPQPVLWDLSRPDQPHGLIAGTTGSGKTNTLLDVLYSLMLHNEPATLRLFVCDPKHSDGMQFLDGLPHVGDVARTLPDVLHRIETFYNEMLHREQGATAKDQRYVLAIEECASLTEHPDKQIRSRVLYWLADIARRSRENNMNLIVCTQKPTADVLGDQLKSNLSMRLVGAVNSKDDALTALNVKQSGAEMLPGYGSFIYRLNRTMFRFQAPLIDTPMGLHRQVVKRWGEGGAWVVQGGAVAPVRTGAEVEPAHRTRVERDSVPAPVRVVQMFPLDDKRALTASEADEVRRLAGTMSKNQLCIHVYGSKSTRYMAWINEALDGKPQPAERSPFSFRGIVAAVKPQ